MSIVRLCLVVLLGTLGLSSVAQADMKWFESMRGYCPDVCQKNEMKQRDGTYIDKENAAYKFAVPSGVHKKTGKPYYICAVDYAHTGWRAGYNIEWGKYQCFAQWIRMNSGKGSYQEHYFCMCANKEMPLITSDMVRR